MRLGPVNMQVILCKKRKHRKPDDEPKCQVYPCIQQVQVHVHHCLLPAVKMQVPEITQHYLQWNNNGIDRYGKQQ